MMLFNWKEWNDQGMANSQWSQAAREFTCDPTYHSLATLPTPKGQTTREPLAALPAHLGRVAGHSMKGSRPDYALDARWHWRSFEYCLQHKGRSACAITAWDIPDIPCDPTLSSTKYCSCHTPYCFEYPKDASHLPSWPRQTSPYPFTTLLFGITRNAAPATQDDAGGPIFLATTPQILHLPYITDVTSGPSETRVPKNLASGVFV